MSDYCHGDAASCTVRIPPCLCPSSWVFSLSTSPLFSPFPPCLSRSLLSLLPSSTHDFQPPLFHHAYWIIIYFYRILLSSSSCLALKGGSIHFAFIMIYIHPGTFHIYIAHNNVIHILTLFLCEYMPVSSLSIPCLSVCLTPTPVCLSVFVYLPSHLHTPCTHYQSHNSCLTTYDSKYLQYMSFLNTDYRLILHVSFLFYLKAD